jgi:putrescine aminotransferase
MEKVVDISVEQVSQQYKNYYNPSLARLMKFSGYGSVEVKSSGSYVYTSDGKKWLDFAGGYGVFIAGHCPAAIVQAVKGQLEKMPLSAKVFFNPVMAQLAQELAELAPGDLQYSFFCNSGAEALEGAIKFARLATGKTGIISAVNAFHGKTLGALSVSGRDLYKTPFEPLLPGCSQVPFGELEPLEAALNDNTAAILLEPIQGEGGIIVPPLNYLPQVEALCRKKGILLIVDEVQTGFARTGKLFAIEHWEVKPDLMTLGKALGGGVMPIGVVMGTPGVWKALEKNPMVHTSTFGGNPLACSAALATLKFIAEENLCLKAQEQGAYLKRGLELLNREYPEIIAEVRGLGLMLGLELKDAGFGGTLILEMSKRGLIGVYTLNQPKVIRFEPPLTVSKAEIDQGLETVKQALDKVKQAFLGGNFG